MDKSRIIDFKELQDDVRGEELEKLAHAILNRLDGVVAFWSGRGPDGGRDLYAYESIPSELHSFRRKWLVDCKHHAHSGDAVREAHVGAITDKLQRHSADAFLLVTTTVPAAGLVSTMEGINADRATRFMAAYWDVHRLREFLLKETFRDILRLYLPASHERVVRADPEALLYEQLEALGVPADEIAEIHGAVVAARTRVSSLQFISRTPAQARASLSDPLAAFDAGNVDEVVEASEGLPFEEWVSLMMHFRSTDRDRAKAVLARTTELASEPDLQFVAAQLLVSGFDYQLSDVARYMRHLDEESLSLLFDELWLDVKAGEILTDHLVNADHHLFDDLPPHTYVEGVHVENVDWTYDRREDALRIECELSVEITVMFGGDAELAQDESLYGNATLTLYGSGDFEVKGVEVDVESWFGRDAGEE